MGKKEKTQHFKFFSIGALRQATFCCLCLNNISSNKRCARLLRAPLLPLFVFDGPLRPNQKRGKEVCLSQNLLVSGMKRIINAFGFEWKEAPGEAEAELGYLSQMGIIDGILSDDVDCFLFGATMVIRDHADTYKTSTLRRNPDRVKIYRNLNFELSREDMIFVALCSGGDYSKGLEGCGIKTAIGLAKAGFGKTLINARKEAATEKEMLTFLQTWRSDLKRELKTNPSGHLGRTFPSLSNNLTTDFPELRVLDLYFAPITSGSKGKSILTHYDPANMWRTEPNLEALFTFCEMSFEWGHQDDILRRFRNLLWTGIAARVLRRVCLINDESGTTSSTSPSPRGIERADGVHRDRLESDQQQQQDRSCLHILASHFFANAVHSIADDHFHGLFVRVTRSRCHDSMDKTLEYYVELDPTPLVEIASQGYRGIRANIAETIWTDEKSDGDLYSENEALGSPSGNHSDRVKIWLPACLLTSADPTCSGLKNEIGRKTGTRARAFKPSQMRNQEKANSQHHIDKPMHGRPENLSDLSCKPNVRGKSLSATSS